MIVGTKDINLEELAQHMKDTKSLESYCMTLVPKYLRHIPEIIMNQKYLVALNIRKIESIPYQKRKSRSEELIKGIHITGVPTTLIDMNDIMCMVDMDKMVRYVKENEK